MGRRARSRSRAARRTACSGSRFAPDFAFGEWVYLFYSQLPDNTNTQVVARFKVNGDTLDLSSEQKVLTFTHQRGQCCHSGGSMYFGPDGSLFIATGDNTNPFDSSGYSPIDERTGRSAWDAQRTSANTNDLNGKILRIKPMEIPLGTPGVGTTYTIPAGNLFDASAQTRPEIYGMGFRDVPAGASAADVVEGGEPAGDVIGLVEGGRAGRHQPDALGGPGQGRQQRERLEGCHGMAALQRLDRHVEHRQMVGHEEGVEPPALQRPGETLQMREIEVGVREGARVAPRAGMNADRPHERAKPQLPCFACHQLLQTRATLLLQSNLEGPLVPHHVEPTSMSSQPKPVVRTRSPGRRSTDVVADSITAGPSMAWSGASASNA